MNKKSILLGITYIIISAFGFAIMNLCVTLSGDLPIYEKMFFRNLLSLFIAAFFFYKDRKKAVWGRSEIKILSLRVSFGTLGILANFYALDHLLLSDASMLNKLSPFFTLVLSALVLKERVNLKQYTLILLAFFGTLFIVKPSLSFNSNMDASLIGVFGGFAAGVAYTCVRSLGNRCVPSSQIVFCFSVFSTILIIPFMIYEFVRPTLYQFLILSLASIGGTIGQFGVTLAYKTAPSREISIFDYFSVIFSAIFGFIFLHQRPDLLSFVGYIIIFISAYLMFLYNRSKKNE